MAETRIGYARVSTHDQNLDLQREALDKDGCARIYTDQISGSVWKLDRLGRSMQHLVELAGDLEQREINLRSITDNIDTTTAAGRFFFHVMAALANMERDLIVERTQAGLESARQKGRVGGRRRKMTEAKIDSAKKLLVAGTPPTDVAATLGVSRATLYRHVPRQPVQSE